MNVTLFRDLAQERWTSMDVYADGLISGLQGTAPSDWNFRCVRPEGLPSQRFRRPALYFDRIVTYGLNARRYQGPINHILDQSYGHLLYFLNQRRSIITYHGGTPVRRALDRKWFQADPAVRFFSWALTGALKAARIIFVSEYSRREILDAYDFDPSRTRVVYYGINELFTPLHETARQAIREHYLGHSEAGLILHVGHCAARKNVETALRAFAELLNQTAAPYRFLQIGGTWSPAQAALIADLGIGSRVTQLAQVPNRELPAFYNAADVFVFSSLYEGFGIPLIEAMACGTPVVCHEYELFHEVCDDAVIYADCTDARALAAAIARALNRTEESAVLRERGLARALQFTWQRCAEQTLAVYRGLADELHA